MSELAGIIDRIHALTERGIAGGGLDLGEMSISLKNYLRVCGELAYTSPDTIRRAQRILGRAIIVHAYFASPVYRDKIDPHWLHDEYCVGLAAGAFVVGKDDLRDTSRWFTGSFESFDNKTSGTTGEPFKYRIWRDSYTLVERDRHYKMILDEFGVKDPVVLYVESAIPGNYREVKYGMARIRVAEKSDITSEAAKMICSHGGFSEYSAIGFDQDAYLYVFDYCRFLIDYIRKHKVNVLMGSGGFFELLTTFLISDESSSFPKLVDLVSNTGDRVNHETLDFLKEAGVAKNWCDHMRCWDGGVSFFTCPHGTTHVQDELAYIYTDGEGKVRSVDFLSYPSPFVNYSGGDYCSIDSVYEKCDCGRWYRPFEFHNRQAKQYLDSNGGYYTTDDVVKVLMEKHNIGFYSTQDGGVSIEDSGLSDEDKRAIILELSKIYVMAYFFRNPVLTERTIRAMLNAPCLGTCLKTQFCYADPGTTVPYCHFF